MFCINVLYYICICFILFAHLLIHNFTEVFTSYAPMGKYCAVFGCHSGYKTTRQKTSSVSLPDVSKARSCPVKRSIFRFPRSIDEGMKWAAAIGRDVEC